MKNRPERLFCFLVVWLTMFSCIWVQGQTYSPEGLKKDFLQILLPGMPGGPISRNDVFLVKKERDKALPLGFFNLNPIYNGVIGVAEVLYTQPADLYYIQSGFFCKREWELEKTTHIPFRFRLGSLADCNALEGKR